MSEAQVTGSVVCPRCRGALSVSHEAIACGLCDWEHAVTDGFLPLVVGERPPPRGLGPRAMQWRPLTRIYERVWRPTFVSIASRRRADRGAERVWIESHMLKAAGGEVADLSCGPGWMARRFATSGAFTAVYGVDLSVPMLEVCVASARRESAPLISVQADVEHLPFRDKSLAGAHAGAALHLWPDPLSALIEVSRVLRPEGVFVASTFVHGPHWDLRHLVEDTFERLSEVRFFEPGQLEALCAAAGLVDFESRVQGGWIVFSARKVS